MSEVVSCSRCGMSWFTRALCERCAFRSAGADPGCSVCHGTSEAGLTPAHSCPEPLPYGVAKMMTDTAQAVGGIVVSQTMKARVRLGLENDESLPKEAPEAPKD